MTRQNVVIVNYADGDTEEIPHSTSMRLDHGWLVITDRIHHRRHGDVERTRSYPPTAISNVITLRPDGD